MLPKGTATLLAADLTEDVPVGVICAAKGHCDNEDADFFDVKVVGVICAAKGHCDYNPDLWSGVYMRRSDMCCQRALRLYSKVC